MDRLFGGLLAGLLCGAVLGFVVFSATDVHDAPVAKSGKHGPATGGQGSDGEVDRLRQLLSATEEKARAAESEAERLKTQNIRLKEDFKTFQLETAVANTQKERRQQDLERAAAAANITLPESTESPEAREARLVRAAKLSEEITLAIQAKDKATVLMSLEELKKAGPGSEAQYIAALKAIVAAGTPSWGRGGGQENQNQLGLNWDEYNRLLTREIRDYLLENASAVGSSPELLRLAGRQVAWDTYLPRDEQGRLLISMLDAATDKDTQLTAVQFMPVNGNKEAMSRVRSVAVNGSLDAEVREAAIGRLSQVAQTDDDVLGMLRTLENDPEPRISTAARRTVLAARPPATGYLVEEVFPRGQAISAGLQSGDIIMVYNGQNVESEDIRPMQNSIPEGQKGELQVHRAGNIVRLYVNRGQLGIDGRFVRKR